MHCNSNHYVWLIHVHSTLNVNETSLCLVSCPPLTAPDNGMIDCTGSLFEDACAFSCDDGYELTGSETRTCQGDQTWSGTESMCVQGVLYTVEYILTIYAFHSGLLAITADILTSISRIFSWLISYGIIN